MLPPISGREAELLAVMQRPPVTAGPEPGWRLEEINSCFCCALHMHQPTIPAGGDGGLISHLQYMVEHPGEGDNHNAEPFAHCYKRMAALIPQLIQDGCRPRIMLDYSGTLLWGFEQMGRRDILDALRYLTCDAVMQRHVEWLGSFWGHAVAPSTPIPDLKLQIQAWQHQFSALFGSEALSRVRGFSPPEMHLPNHPDTLYAFVKALKECGYQWLLVQEHSVENLDGSALSDQQRYLPNQLVARNSDGEQVSITALIKTQGSDTKLVGQMQPCYEALGMAPLPLADQMVPPLVAQIADGENGGVMMNEFPSAFIQAHHTLRDQPLTVAMNGSEYLELLNNSERHWPSIQAVRQHQLWQQLEGRQGAAAVEAAIKTCTAADAGFSMEGASWTNNLSWVEGYDNVLGPMQQLSAAFHQKFDSLVAEDASITRTPAYQEALLHLMLLETSCFRYWGQGVWTEYAHELDQRGRLALRQ